MGAVGLLTLSVLSGGAGVYSFGSSCDLGGLSKVRTEQNTLVYAADGSLLGSIPAQHNRQVVPIASVSTWMPTATIAIEDRRFYSDGGIDPDTNYDVSAPFTHRLTAAGTCDDGSSWCVKTYDSTYDGWTSISRATLRSDHTVYAELTLDVGPKRVGEMARKLGVLSELEVDGHDVPAMGRGSVAVSPLDMASAYATLAAGDMYSEPTAIRRAVFPDGKDDTGAGWNAPKRTRVISDGVAWKVPQILEDNVRYGTGTRASIGRAAAGKTETTDRHADAWSVGYTPDLATAVWMGCVAGEIPMENVHGIAVSGGSFPAEIWRLLMERTIGLRPAREFAEPKALHRYEPFVRGPLSLSYDPLYMAPATSTETDTTAVDTTAAPLPVRLSVTAPPAPKP